MILNLAIVFLCGANAALQLTNGKSWLALLWALSGVINIIAIYGRCAK